MPRIAVLLTCHNRVEFTVACLESLFDQEGIDGLALDVVLVDAGSTDGTVEAIAQRFPEVTVITRGPELFWNGGMSVALAEAYERDPDLYVWLNDDVRLDRSALRTLLSCHRELAGVRPKPSIVVGSTRDPTSGELTYGGLVRPDRWRPLHYELVPPGETPKQAETMNGNFTMIPREVVASIGNLSKAYTHSMGDYDYGHRATRAGFEVWVAPGTIGTCSKNRDPDRAGSLAEHRQRVTSPTGGLPPAEWSTFARRWAGPLWPIYAASPYVRRSMRWMLRR